MDIEKIAPAEIERRSMEIIESEMGDTSHLSESEKLIVKRVIHATADFDYLRNIKFSENAVQCGLDALRNGAVIITDTNMALSGISKPALEALGCEACCFSSDTETAGNAKKMGTTRAVAAIDKSVKLFKDRRTIYAIGNAPTALIRLHELICKGKVKPELVIAVPVGFVNVVQSKSLIMTDSVPYIVSAGRKGGSTVSAAICNALLYQLYKRNQNLSSQADAHVFPANFAADCVDLPCHTQVCLRKIFLPSTKFPRKSARTSCEDRFSVMPDEFVYHGKSKLRCGYTTGTCAAAAAKAAVEALLTGAKVTETEITTPKGITPVLPVSGIEIHTGYVLCGVRKDSGDDPDITNGMLICAKAERIPYGIEVTGGEGVGIVTKPGLDQPVGQAAINSTPRKMIELAVSEICEKHGYEAGIKITVSVPEGRNIAEKTFNPRMGIEGGISIIGTTGIVEPMSNSAVIETIRTEMRMRHAENRKNILLTIGNYSEDYIENILPFMKKYSVICSNFVGEAIDAALEYGFESVLIVGHAGKLVKLGAGIMNTHSSQADGRMEVLAACGISAGADIKTLGNILECVTVDAAFELLKNCGILEKAENVLMKKIQYHLEAKVKNEIKIGAVTFSYKFGLIGKTDTADEIINRLREEYND